MDTAFAGTAPATSAAITRGWRRSLRRRVFYLSPLLLLALWQGVALAGWFPATLLVPPWQVAQTAAELWRDGTLRDALAASLYRLAAGFGSGTALGLLAGIAFGTMPRVERSFGLVFNILRQVPTVSLVPLFVLVFGIEESFKVAMIAFAAFFPVALNTMDGLRHTPRAYLDVAAVLCFDRRTRLRRVLLPAALPAIATGVRLALSRSWMILVAAELFASNDGLGHLMDSGRQFFQIDMVMVGVVLTGAIGFALDLALQAVERRLAHGSVPHP